jgi:hypothetical protein
MKHLRLNNKMLRILRISPRTAPAKILITNHLKFVQSVYGSGIFSRYPGMLHIPVIFGKRFGTGCAVEESVKNIPRSTSQAYIVAYK